MRETSSKLKRECVRTLPPLASVPGRNNGETIAKKRETSAAIDETTVRLPAACRNDIGATQDKLSYIVRSTLPWFSASKCLPGKRANWF